MTPPTPEVSDREADSAAGVCHRFMSTWTAFLHFVPHLVRDRTTPVLLSHLSVSYDIPYKTPARTTACARFTNVGPRLWPLFPFCLAKYCGNVGRLNLWGPIDRLTVT